MLCGHMGRTITRARQHWLDTAWDKVWRNLWTAPISDEMKNSWYKVAHDIIPTRMRLHSIRLAPTDECAACGEQESLLHQLAECGEGNRQWD